MSTDFAALSANAPAYTPALSPALGRLVAARRREFVYVCYAEYATDCAHWPVRLRADSDKWMLYERRHAPSGVTPC